jgi:hypothetical protein
MKYIITDRLTLRPLVNDNGQVLIWTMSQIPTVMLNDQYSLIPIYDDTQM